MLNTPQAVIPYYLDPVASHGKVIYSDTDSNFTLSRVQLYCSFMQMYALVRNSALGLTVVQYLWLQYLRRHLYKVT